MPRKALKSKLAVGYIRVSTDDQVQSGLGLEDQEHREKPAVNDGEASRNAAGHGERRS